MKRAQTVSTLKKYEEQRYPLILHFLSKNKLNRKEISAIFGLVVEVLLKRNEFFVLAEEEKEEKRKEEHGYLPLKTSRECPVCSSPYRWQYELYYLSCGRNLEWVLSAVYSLNEHHITYTVLKNHFQKHFNPQFDISKASQKSLEKIIHMEGPDFVENVLCHFLSTNKMLEKMEERVLRLIEEGKEVPSRDVNLLKSLLITFLRYAIWLSSFPKKEDEEVKKLGTLFPFEI